MDLSQDQRARWVCPRTMCSSGQDIFSYLSLHMQGFAHGCDQDIQWIMQSKSSLSPISGGVAGWTYHVNPLRQCGQAHLSQDRCGCVLRQGVQTQYQGVPSDRTRIACFQTELTRISVMLCLGTELDACILRGNYTNRIIRPIVEAEQKRTSPVLNKGASKQE